LPLKTRQRGCMRPRKSSTTLARIHYLEGGYLRQELRLQRPREATAALDRVLCQELHPGAPRGSLGIGRPTSFLLTPLSKNSACSVLVIRVG
jgi:hypothetical protein